MLTLLICILLPMFPFCKSFQDCLFRIPAEINGQDIYYTASQTAIRLLLSLPDHHKEVNPDKFVNTHSYPLKKQILYLVKLINSKRPIFAFDFTVVLEFLLAILPLEYYCQENHKI